MMRSDHYRAADELLGVYDTGLRGGEFMIPDLLRAVAHALLATADSETEFAAHMKHLAA